MTRADRIILKTKKISKSYPGVQALNNINFELKEGEIRALVGENGAGKSTFVKIIGGVEKLSSGKIQINNEFVNISNPMVALNLGIAIVHQELSLFPNLNISTNLFFSEIDSSTRIFISDQYFHEKAKKVLFDFGLADITPQTKVGELEPGQQQLIEIARAVVKNAKIIVLDEPTSSLSKNETEVLFSLIRKLKMQGVSIIFVSHRLDEVFELCDSITIFRDGKHILTSETRNLTRSELVELILGREEKEMYQATRKQKQESPLLQVNNLVFEPKIKNISFTLSRGEILGIAGLLGSGKTELVRAIFGLEKPNGGTITLKGKPIKIESPKQAISYGLGFITEDRHNEGLLLENSIRDNIILGNINAYANQFGWMNPKLENKTAEHQKKQLNIISPNIHQKVKFLSGGNQQKVVLAKWLEVNPQIFILDDPTRGIDVGAKAEFYRLIANLAEKGAGIIFISSEIQEVVQICHRALVLRNGKINGEFSGKDLTCTRLLMSITGEK